MSKKEFRVEGSYEHTLTIPREWSFTPFNNVIEIVGGSQPPKSEFSSEQRDGFIRLIQIRDYKSNGNLVYIPIEKAKRFVSTDDIMIGRYGPPIFQILRGLEGAYNVALMKAKPVANSINKDFLFYYLRNRDLYNYVEAASDRTAGQSGVNKAHLEKYPVGLPSLAEQQVIADKLDALLAQVATTKTRLERVPETIKRFRQSVLAAAVSGKLTETETPWRNEKLGDCFKCIDGDRGSNYPKKHDYLDSGYCLFLSTKNVRNFGFEFSDQVYISEEKDSILRNGRLERGDLVITTRGTLGHVASYDLSIPFDRVRINSGMLILRKKDSKFKNEYFKILIASPYFQKMINDLRTGSAQPQLPAKVLKEFDLPIPGYTEQQEIVRRVEELFAHADAVEQQAKAALEKVNNLTQSILAKAFRGELTADWRAANPELISGENSAEALLARIKEERAAQKPKKRATTRRKKKVVSD